MERGENDGDVTDYPGQQGQVVADEPAVAVPAVHVAAGLEPGDGVDLVEAA